ncbi:MAG: S8 family serine peptidase [Promethearchaeota archaeon]
MNRKYKNLIVLLIILFSQISMLMSLTSFNGTSATQFNQIDQINERNNPKTSDDGTAHVIVLVNKPTFNGTILTNFTNYKGIKDVIWNNTLTSFSGFAGTLPEENITIFQNTWPDLIVETDEIINAQLNYASLQSGAINSTWYVNGFKGETNSSIAVLDTGINADHSIFPNGYNSAKLKGDIIGWQDFVDSEVNPMDNHGHGTFISSVIAGTGAEPYNSSNPVNVNLIGNYSHFDLFNTYADTKNYTIKLFSFNISEEVNYINISSVWEEHANRIDGFWIELYKDSQLVNISKNMTINQKYYVFHNTTNSGEGIYDVYLTYLYHELTAPVFSYTINISYLSEFYIKNYSYFTGIANGTKIVSYKILNETGIGYVSDLISALEAVILNKEQLHIVSVCLSVATLGEDVEAINLVIDQVIENGTMVVIAAGNYGVEYQEGTPPLNRLAIDNNAIVVGAINDLDQVTSYSSMGSEDDSEIDIVAPGGSTLPGHRSIVAAGNDTGEITAGYGTSIATAIVSSSINLLIDAKWDTWEQWRTVNITKWTKILKSILLLTASETGTDREDDPDTSIDESEYSPTNYLDTILTGLKDEHEGYGRLNIQAAIDALTKYLPLETEVNGTLISSAQDPLGTHVFARKIKFDPNIQYLINMTYEGEDADFDIFIFSNESNQYGEPILIKSSRRAYGDFDSFYFTPLEDQLECILVIKAIVGNDTFYLNTSIIKNEHEPKLKVGEISTLGGTKNATVLSTQYALGNNPPKNYTIDTYTFYIEYWDNDTAGVPPQEVYVSIEGTNYTMTQVNPLDNNYTNGALFYTNEAIQFKVADVYDYFFYASDGLYKTISKVYQIEIFYPEESKKVPIEYWFGDFDNLNEVEAEGWIVPDNDIGWDIIDQINYFDDRARVHPDPGGIPGIGVWNTLYFGRQPYVLGTDYSYQPLALGDPYPNGSITSPLFNLTKLGDNYNPVAKFGIRVSINSLDYVYLQINVNWSGWTTLKTYTNTENEWNLEQINLTQYKGSYIQFRIDTAINTIFDPIKNNGFILDYFAIENYTNTQDPYFDTSIFKGYVTPTVGTKYEQFTFYCDYFDIDNNYPEYVQIEINNGEKYDMYNLEGDWWANSTGLNDYGIRFSKSLIIGDMNRTFRFIASSDGKKEIKTDWFNENDDLIDFSNPTVKEYNTYKSEKAIGYNFSTSDLSDFYVAGTPTPQETTAWLAGDNTWHPIQLGGEDYLYGGIGDISYGADNMGYGTNWNAKLITRPVRLRDEYTVYLMFDSNVSLQPEVFPLYLGNNPDYCDIHISTDYGNTWTFLKRYSPNENDPTGGSGFEKIDLSKYRNSVVMIQFRLRSNDQTTLFGFGWFLQNIYLGYDPDTDFIAPEVKIITPENKDVVSSEVIIKGEISDDIALATSRIQVYINDEAVDIEDFEFDKSKGILELKWDTRKVSDGLYEITIVAFDEIGNRAEDSIIVEVDNGYVDWVKWAPWIIIILIAVVVGLALFVLGEKKGKTWVNNLMNTYVEKIRLKEIDREQSRKFIEELSPEEEFKRPIILNCKFCDSWFITKEEFDIMCPVCDHDQIYAVYNCVNCHRWYRFETPSEEYYCPKCSKFDKFPSTEKRLGKIKKVKELNKKESFRLIRREITDVEKILEEEGKVLRKFEIKPDKKMSILD